MRREIEMPRLSETVDEGVLVTWLVQPGATVSEGDLMAEVQFEKTSSDVLAPYSGRVESLLAGPGDVVSQGATIAVIETAEPLEVAAPSPITGPPPSAGPVAPPAPPAEAPAPTGEIVASPAAKRLARELGVDLGSVAGSGPGGRIVEADVEAAAATAAARPAPAVPAPGASVAGAPAAPVASAPAAGPIAAPEEGVEPHTPMRRTIAERLRSGLASTAQLTITAEADVTDLESRLAAWSTRWGRRASYTEAIVRACALALREHPRIAARWTDGGLIPAARIDVGVAVALDDGLIVPVVRDADAKDLQALGREIAGLAERARAGTLAQTETEGACFSVTNLGAHRIDAFTPLLNPPQTAILGVGRARPRPAAVDGAVVVRTLVVLSLTFDHRVVDGAPAAAFLDSVIRLLERPELIEAG